MLMEYSKKKGYSFNDDDEDIFDALAIAREIIDLDYLHKNGEEIASESLVSSPFCVVLMLIRTIELMQEDLSTKQSKKKTTLAELEKQLNKNNISIEDFTITEKPRKYFECNNVHCKSRVYQDYDEVDGYYYCLHCDEEHNKDEVIWKQ